MNHEQRLMSSLLLFFLLQPCTSIDTITSKQSISEDDLLVSSGENFALGFFSPGNSGNHYVGIWYHKVPERTVVWVANRDHPINDTTGVLSINQTGNLVLHAQDTVFWSSNVSATSTKNCTAQLLDSGNLVLVQSDKRVIWQSFDYPTDTMLPVMKLGLDRKTGLDRFLTSWKSRDDPGTGDCSYRFDTSGSPQLFLYKDKGTSRCWRTGPWNGIGWSGIPQMKKTFIFTTSFVNNDDEISLVYSMTNASIFSRLMVNEFGSVQRLTWHEAHRRWNGFYSAPKDQCDIYNHCGANSNCNLNNAVDFECTCLPGYKPKYSRDWYLRDTSGGCVMSRVGSSTCGSGDGFVKVEGVKVPDTSTARVDTGMSMKACKEECLRNCLCRGYTSADVRGGGSGCVTWYGDLTDTRQYAAGGQELYIRVDAAELAQHAKKYKGFFHKKGMLEIVVMSIIVNLFPTIFFTYRLVLRKRKGRQGRPKFVINVTTGSKSFEDSSRETELDESRTDPSLHLFELSTILAATDNFSLANKLGEGGFGSVYKIMILGSPSQWTRNSCEKIIEEFRARDRRIQE